MNLIRKAIQSMSAGAGVLKDPAFHIHEVHHIHKKMLQVVLRYHGKNGLINP